MKDFEMLVKNDKWESIPITVKGEELNDDVFIVSPRNSYNRKLVESHMLFNEYKIVDKATGIFVCNAKTKKELLQCWENKYKEKYYKFKKTKEYLEVVEKYGIKASNVEDKNDVEKH